VKGYRNLHKFGLRAAVTEELAVRCHRCGNVWNEQVTHYGVLAGYARTYDYCDKCITQEDAVSEHTGSWPPHTCTPGTGGTCTQCGRRLP
jgi:hypothetical protein